MLHTFQKLHIIDAVNFNSFVPESCKSAHDYGGHLGEGKEERGSENALLNALGEDRIVLQGGAGIPLTPCDLQGVISGL